MHALRFSSRFLFVAVWAQISSRQIQGSTTPEATPTLTITDGDCRIDIHVHVYARKRSHLGCFKRSTGVSLGFASPRYNVLENKTSVQVCIVLNRGSMNSVMVELTVSIGGSATAG